MNVRVLSIAVKKFSKSNVNDQIRRLSSADFTMFRPCKYFYEMAKNNRQVSINEAAKMFGVTPTTLRNWDKSGKLVPQRNPDNGYRLYSVEEVAKVLEETGTLYLPFKGGIAQEVATQTLDDRAFKKLIRQMSAAFRDSEGGGLLERFEEITKLLYLKLFDEQCLEKDPEFPSAFNYAYDSDDQFYTQLSTRYRTAANDLAHLSLNGRGELSGDVAAIARVARLLSRVNLRDAEMDIKGIAYEELVRNTFEKTENQQFFTPRPVVKFMVDLVKDFLAGQVCDPACGSGGFLIEAMRCGCSPEHIRAIEVDKRMAWVSQMNLLLHGGSDAKVYYFGGDGSLDSKRSLADIDVNGGLDVILTNPPFGSDLSNPESLARFQLGRGKSKRRRGALFIERCIKWLKAGTGRLAIVVDDSILNGNLNEDLRALVLKECHIEAIVSLPETAFKPYASVETSIVLMRRRQLGDLSANDNVFMATARRVGRKPNGEALYKRTTSGDTVLDNDLETIARAWRKYLEEDTFDNEEATVAFVCSSDQFATAVQRCNRLDVLFHHPARKVAEEALKQVSYPVLRLSELVEVRGETALPNAIDPHDTWRYVGLANIEAETGNYEVIEVFGSEIKSAVRRFESGDVVFSKLRPELRKTFFAQETEEAYVSSECYVLCPKISPEKLDPRYLAIMLRSEFIYGQLVYQVSGTGRPRIGRSAVLSLQIPLPSISVQHTIIASHEKAHKQYLQHLESSRQEVAAGRRALVGAEETALSSLLASHSLI